MKIKNPPFNQTANRVSLDSNTMETLLDRIDYPVFCFRHLHDKYGVDQCINADRSFLKQFLKKINLVSKMSWQDIQLSDKHGHGTEKIAKTSIKKTLPTTFTMDVEDFLSFYFNGTKGRIIGHRNKSLFHILYIDTKLDVYDH